MNALLAIAAALSFLPDPNLTPGVVDTNVTAEMLRVPAFIKARRNVPVSEKKEVFARYGIPWSQHSRFEIDHYVPLCIGGVNTISNLWPEVWGGKYGAHAKDRIECFLHRRVNKGQMTLQEAQSAFLDGPWTNAFSKYGLKPGLRTTVFKLTHKAVK